MKKLFLTFLLLFSMNAQDKIVAVLVHGVNSNPTFWNKFSVDNFKRLTGVDNVIKVFYANGVHLSKNMKTFETDVLTISKHWNGDANFWTWKFQNKNMDECSNDLKVVLEHRSSLKKLNNNTKYIFITHSLGGLVTRNLIRLYPEYKDKIKAIYTLGTPHKGSPAVTTEFNTIVKSLEPKFEDAVSADVIRYDRYGVVWDKLFGNGKSFKAQLKEKLNPDYKIMKDLAPGSDALRKLKNDNLNLYSFAGIESGQLFYKLAGSGVKTGYNKTWRKVLLLYIHNEYEALQKINGRKNLFKARSKRWYNIAKSTYKKGYKALRDLPGAYHQLLKSYKTKTVTKRVFIPCRDEYDDRERDFDDRDIYKISIFGRASSRCQNGGYYTTVTNVQKINLPTDGVVPEEYARYDGNFKNYTFKETNHSDFGNSYDSMTGGTHDFWKELVSQIRDLEYE
jgi:hypothetical protein